MRTIIIWSWEISSQQYDAILCGCQWFGSRLGRHNCFYFIILFPWAKSISVSKIDLAATLSHHCSPSRLSHPRPVHTAKLALWTGKKISPLHHLHLELQLPQGRQTVRAAGAAETAPSASCCYDDRRRSSRATAGWSASGSATQSQACRDVDRAL